MPHIGYASDSDMTCHRLLSNLKGYGAVTFPDGERRRVSGYDFRKFIYDEPDPHDELKGAYLGSLLFKVST